MSQDLSHWLVMDIFSVDEASLLFAGIEPYEVEGKLSVAVEKKLPRSAKALTYKAALMNEGNSKKGLISKIVYRMMYDGKPWVDEGEQALLDREYWSLSKKDALKFAAVKGIDFPYGCPVPEVGHEDSELENSIEQIMIPTHANYSENLMEAITVWKELAELSSTDDLSKPRKKAEEILRGRYPHWSKRRIDAITQVVNWTENTEKSSVLSPPRPVTLKKVKESA